MSAPTVFLSAATVDLKEWREVLDGAFRRGGFHVLTQDKSLRSAPGDVKRLLVETIAGSDCIIHLAGLGYGSDASDPFPDQPGFQCSWTQFEYYHGHREGKGVIAFVCSPNLSMPGFVEKGSDDDVARKQRLQNEHRERVKNGTFDNTPLQTPDRKRTSNESVDSVAALLTAVAAAVGTLHKLDRDACAKAQHELSVRAAELAEIKAGVGTVNEKLDQLLARPLASVAAAPPRQLPTAASRYFGRASLVSDLASRLRKQKRTDVWGGPGMGKTALAAEAVTSIIGDDAADLASSPFPHGVVFLDLYRHKDLETAWQALANAFDDSLPTDMPAVARATKACAHRQALIILEGAEELRDRLETFLTMIAPESTLLVLTREESQTAAGRRIKLDDFLDQPDALALLRHLAGTAVPQAILEAVQQRFGGHPLALTWAGSQLGDATQPAASFLRDLEASPMTKLTEPGGDPNHSLRWMFDRSVRLMSDATRTVLAAVSRISEPFDEAWAVVAGGTESDLQRLVQLSFLRLSSDSSGWQFAHALAAQFARELPLPEGLLATLGGQAIIGITSADARCHLEGTAPLDLALGHATALLEHNGVERVLRPVATSLVYHHEDNTIGIRRGRLDFARRAVEAVLRWQQRAADAEQATPAWQRELSVSFERLGNLATAQGNLSDAQRLFGESLRIRQRLAESDLANAKWQRDLSVSFVRLGDLAMAQGNLTESQRLFGESLSIAQRLAECDPANAKWQRDLSVLFERLGDLATARGNLPEAQRHFGESLRIRQRLAESDSANADWQFDLATLNGRLGMLYQDQGDLPETERYYREYQRSVQRLAESDPANTAWQRGLSVSCNKLGELATAQGNLPEAQRLFGESLRIRQRLAESDPANAAWQRDLSVSFNKLGDLATAQGNLPEAQRLFGESLRIAQRLAESDPANAAWQFDLGISNERLGGLAAAQGNLDEAHKFHSARHAIIERLAESDPANAAWQRDLWVSYWRVARVLEQQESDEAMNYWRKALDTLTAMVEKGMFVSPEDMQSLDGLRAKVDR